MVASDCPAETRLPMRGKASRASRCPAVGALTTASPSLRALMTPVARTEAYSGRRAAFSVAKSTFHCCSLRKLISSPCVSSAGAAAAAAAESGWTVQVPRSCRAPIAGECSRSVSLRSPACSGSTPGREMPGLDGPSTLNTSSGRPPPDKRTVTRPSVTGRKSSSRVRWAAKPDSRPIVSGGNSTNSSVTRVKGVTATAPAPCPWSSWPPCP
jgi:hypothetical protein